MHIDHMKRILSLADEMSKAASLPNISRLLQRFRAVQHIRSKSTFLLSLYQADRLTYLNRLLRLALAPPQLYDAQHIIDLCSVSRRGTVIAAVWPIPLGFKWFQLVSANFSWLS
jgi:hypothetical protein